MSLDYSEYLKVPELLSLQQPRAHPQEHDEVLFIIVHQSYELWFKQLLHESTLLDELLAAGRLHMSIKTLRRMEKIFRLCIEKVDVLETMTPRSFENFRAFLETASGFQSYQFRRLEVLFGFFSPLIVRAFPERSAAYQDIQRQKSRKTLWEMFCGYVREYHEHIPLPKRAATTGNMHNRLSAAARKTLSLLIARSAEVSLLTELFLTLDEKLQEWRYRHVQLATRIIGSQQGTGGSEGVDYLKKTLHKVAFPDLWELRLHA